MWRREDDAGAKKRMKRLMRNSKGKERYYDDNRRRRLSAFEEATKSLQQKQSNCVGCRRTRGKHEETKALGTKQKRKTRESESEMRRWETNVNKRQTEPNGEEVDDKKKCVKTGPIEIRRNLKRRRTLINK
ncbi:hypothetical protein RUM43_007829 [Polyplax serrata]|uniref:Uncharacterized protein n=1 Tax=Polyplax serrata TaxID=468196 RepID=A0AAN8SA92_POLSC